MGPSRSTFDKYEQIIEICKRRGILWPSYEIYGGLSGFVDLGPIGVSILEKIKDEWRDLFVRKNNNVEISSPILAPAIVFKASGHLSHFKDPIVECTKCAKKFRADQLLPLSQGDSLEGLSLKKLQTKLSNNDMHCPDCGGHLSKPSHFLTMFKTTIGPYRSSIGYIRPETAQGMFVDFKRVFESSRERFPIGIAQIGKALRNEISPRQGLIRLREFTLMEFEFFFNPNNESCKTLTEVSNHILRILPTDMRLRDENEPIEIDVKTALDQGIITSQWMAYFMAISMNFLNSLGIPPKKQLFHEKLPNERAHYSKQTFDLEIFLDRWGWIEVAGFAHRSNHDLKSHMKSSKIDLSIYPTNSTNDKKFIPEVVEPSFGAERLLYAILEYSYHHKEDRVILQLPRRIAPFHAAVFPLLSKEKFINKSEFVYHHLIANRFDIYHDHRGSIGRRYARADEIGIPIAITIDHQTLDDNTVTIRDRDTWKQKRVQSESLIEILLKYYSTNILFDDIT